MPVPLPPPSEAGGPFGADPTYGMGKDLIRIHNVKK